MSDGLPPPQPEQPQPGPQQPEAQANPDPQPVQQPQQPDQSQPEPEPDQQAQPKPDQQPEPQPAEPWAQPWAAPPPPPRTKRTGLLVTLCVGGALVAAGAVGTLAYAMAGEVEAAVRAEESAWSAEWDEEPFPEESGDQGFGDEEFLDEDFEDEVPAAEPTDDGAAAAKDVTVTGCTRDAMIQWPEAELKIVNGTTGPADYVVSVEFLDADGTQVSDGIATVTGLAPEATAKRKAQGLGEAPAGTTCRVTDVWRTSSTG